MNKKLIEKYADNKGGEAGRAGNSLSPSLMNKKGGFEQDEHDSDDDEVVEDDDGNIMTKGEYRAMYGHNPGEMALGKRMSMHSTGSNRDSPAPSPVLRQAPPLKAKAKAKT